ncbi:hypothetical protein [uncultured Xanthomonas sp.]|uniref:hypothetical protein n=1 Tax=uncultured Xanthomonas sp. TaxID=152831 RepID=UPI0025D6D40C|nr:hypothetical protein [uncultured Xanthomonas sp.]
MPGKTIHTLITWIPDSANDGEREAKRLNARFSAYSNVIDGRKLTSSALDGYMSLIVVGHRSELLKSGVLGSLTTLVRGSQCPWVVLANCASGTATQQGTLGDNELWEPAQKLANDLKIRVSGTTRALTFDEVGQGTAFALARGEVLIRSNPPGTSGLWKDFHPQDGIEQITQGLRNL